MSHSVTDQIHENKDHLEIELGQFNLGHTTDIDDNNVKDLESNKAQLEVTSPSRSILTRRKISIESEYSIANINDQRVRKSTKMEGDNLSQNCDNDLNDSQIQLEKLLFPPATSESNGFKSFTKYKSLSNVPKGRSNQIVRVHSSGEVLDSNKSVKFSHQEDEDFRAPTGQSKVIFSKFLDKNEFHEIWKPSKAKTRRISLPGQSLRSVSPSSQHPFSSDQQDETKPPRAPSPIMTSKDLRLRQQQLLEHIALAREVSKDQNIKLLSHINECGTTPGNKFQHLVNAALVQKQNATTGSNNARLKWKKAVLLSRDKSDTVRPLTAVKFANKQHVIDHPSQDHQNNNKPFMGTAPQSRSECHLNPSSPSTRSILKTRATCAAIDTKSPPANVRKGNSVVVNQVSFQNVDVPSSCKVTTPLVHEKMGVAVDVHNNSRCDDMGSDSDANQCNSSTGCSWSGYDTTSTAVMSFIGTPMLDEINTISAHAKFTRSTSLYTDQHLTATKHCSAFRSKQSQFSDNLSPPGIEVVDKITTNYQPYSHSSSTSSCTGLLNSKKHPGSSKSSMCNVRSLTETPATEDDDQSCSKLTESFNQRSAINLPFSHHPVLSSSSVIPQVAPATSSFDNTSEFDLISQISSEVTSLFAGQQEHRHNEKSSSIQL